MGSHFGLIYTLDHLGNVVEGKEILAHTIAVNQISIDIGGEFIASCSDDGKIIIHGLYSNDHNDTINVGRVVKTIALDPNFHKAGSGGRYIIGKTTIKLFCLFKTIFLYFRRP